MSDLEDRLRAAVGRRSEDFEPSADLPDRIVARVDHRRRVRRVMAGTALTAAAAVVVVALAAANGGRHEGRVITGMHTTTTRAPSTTATTGAPATTSTTAGTTTTTTGGTGTTAGTVGTSVPAATAPAIDFLTPLSRQGIGPIRAGMTLRAARAATSTTITPSAGPGGTCVPATIAGLDGVVLLVEPPRAPDTDILDGVVRAVNGSVLPTAEGAQIGQSRAELIAALGQPTRTIAEPSATAGPAQVLVYESGGYAYGALVTSNMVLGLSSGDPAWVHLTNGCSE